MAALETIPSFSSRSYHNWADLRLKRQIVDYLIRQGYTKSALALDDSGLTDVEINLFQELVRIEFALKSRSAAEALTWCKASKVKALETDLRFQEFIELARQDKKLEAIAYCRKHRLQTKQGMALLAFRADTACPPYKALYDPARWTELANKFRNAFLSYHGLPSIPLLSLSLWAGLAGLKLPSCSKAENVDCPTCTVFKDFEVPSGLHTTSTIVCRVTGRVLAGEDALYAMPDGTVWAAEFSKGGGKRVYIT